MKMSFRCVPLPCSVRISSKVMKSLTPRFPCQARISRNQVRKRHSTANIQSFYKPVHTQTSSISPYTMVLRLRLARIAAPGGAKRHNPQYNIVLAHARSARDGKPMEVLGTYNLIPQTPVGASEADRQTKQIKLDVSRTKYWLGVGAQPSDTVWRLLSMVSPFEAARARGRV